jgi:nickel transport system permease protein
MGWAIFTLLFVSFFAFTLTNLIPADPAEVALRVNDVFPTPEAIEDMREELGLNKPFLLRYVIWLLKCARLDFGVSFTNTNRAVVDELARSFPFTLRLSGMALLFLVLTSVPLGVLSAVYKDRWFDRGLRGLVFAGTSVPNYWLAFLLIWIFSLKFKWLPSSGASELKHYILPAFSLSTLYIATYIRLIRTSMLENMKENYVLYARARGISERKVVWKHVLKNSLQSSMTAIGIGIVRILSGTVVIESIFAIPGLGRLCLASIFNRDYPTIQAYILVIGYFFVFANLMIDILHCVVDPRLKQGVVQ